MRISVLDQALLNTEEDRVYEMMSSESHPMLQLYLMGVKRGMDYSRSPSSFAPPTDTSLEGLTRLFPELLVVPLVGDPTPRPADVSDPE